MKKLCAFIGLIFGSVAMANDMGAYGKVFPIAEENLLIQIKNKATRMVESGEWDTIKEKSIQKAKEKADQPANWEVPTATVLNERTVDPTVMLEQDVRDHQGRLLYAAGTKINPLNYIEFQKTLVLFDGRDQKQIKFVKDYIKDKSHDIVLILVGGSVHQTAKALNRRVYVDQWGQYIERFKVRYVPSIVEIDGQMIKVTEQPPNV